MRASACILFFAGLLLVWLDVAAALEVPEANYPPLAKSASSPEGFVPQGWRIDTQTEGDLNGDGLPDLLLVLQQDDPANVLANDPDSLGVRALDTNPRILAVAFAREKGGYELSLENHDLIPRYETPTIDDPFSQAEIIDGAIRVGLHFWANAGSWYTDDTTFIFRYRDNAFRLAGYEEYTTKRNTGETWDVKIDYLAGKAEITLGNFSDDESEDKTYQKPLSPSPLLTIKEVGGGWDFHTEEQDLSWWGLEESGG